MAHDDRDSDKSTRPGGDPVDLESILIALDQVQQTVEVMHSTIARLKDSIHSSVDSDTGVRRPATPRERKMLARLRQMRRPHRLGSATPGERKRVTH